MQQAKVISFPVPVPGERADLVSTLQALLAAAERGEADGLWFMVDMQGQHRYGALGSYLAHPEKAYIPACKALYGLGSLIDKDSNLT